MAFLGTAQSETDAKAECYHRAIETIRVDTEAASPQNDCERGAGLAEAGI